MVTRRAYAGGAKAGALTSPISAIDPTAVCDALLGWPTGSSGNFAAVIGRGLGNEEKVLCSARSGAVLTIVQRGYDGTTAQAHGATETVEHVITATDADEANAHTAVNYGHGIPPGDRLVGEVAVQTLTGKTMDGGDNTFVDLPLNSSPETKTRIEDIEAVNVAQGSAIDALPTVAEVNALILPVATAVADTYSKSASDLRYEPIDSAYTKVESDLRYEPLDSAYTKAELDALLLSTIPAPINLSDGTNFSFTNVSASPTSGGVSDMNGTIIVPPSGRLKVTVSAVIRASAGGGSGQSGYIGYQLRQTNVGGALLLASDVSRAALNENLLAVSSAMESIISGLTPGSVVFAQLLHWVDSGTTGACRSRRLVVQGA